jgi:hypothetical protein
MAKIKSDKTYILRLAKFCQRLQADQNKTRAANALPEVLVYSETGRKFDKVYIDGTDVAPVRYFVERQTGNIYGAKSQAAPNLSWYFGTLERAEKWDWSEFHGQPVEDNTVRFVKSYGPYKHYMLITE